MRRAKDLDRMKKKVIPFLDLSNYKVLKEEVDAVYLSWERTLCYLSS